MDCISHFLNVAGPYFAAIFIGMILLKTSAARSQERAVLNEKLAASAHAQTIAVERVHLAMSSFGASEQFESKKR